MKAATLWRRVPPEHMGTPKLQHYIPQMILRRFTDQSGWLCCCHVEDPQRPIWRSKPEHVFAENHLYTVINDRDEFDFSVEKDFSVLEGQVSPVIDKIVLGAQSGQAPQLGVKEREVWCRYLVLQQRRVPDVSRPVVGANLDSLIDEIPSLMESDIGRPLTSDEMARFKDPDNQSGLRRNAVQYFAATSPRSDLLKRLQAASIVTAVIRNEKKSLICGSHPIAGFHEWFCVHQRVAVRLEPSISSDQLAYLDESSEIRRINQNIVNRSTFFAGPSRTLVESLARPR